MNPHTRLGTATRLKDPVIQEKRNKGHLNETSAFQIRDTIKEVRIKRTVHLQFVTWVALIFMKVRLRIAGSGKRLCGGVSSAAEPSVHSRLHALFLTFVLKFMNTWRKNVIGSDIIRCVYSSARAVYANGCPWHVV